MMMEDSPYCAGCNAELKLENAWMEDGCPCNHKKHCNTFNWHRWRLLLDLQQQQSKQLAAAEKREAVLMECVKGYAREEPWALEWSPLLGRHVRRRYVPQDDGFLPAQAALERVEGMVGTPPKTNPAIEAGPSDLYGYSPYPQTPKTYKK